MRTLLDGTIPCQARRFSALGAFDETVNEAKVPSDRRSLVEHLLPMGRFQPVHCKLAGSQEKRALLRAQHSRRWVCAA